MPFTGAGSLNQRISFSKPFMVDDGYGNHTDGWQDMFTVQANVTSELGGEAMQAARLAGRQSYFLVVRQTPDTRQIRTDWRAIWRAPNQSDEDIFLNIRSISDPHSGDVERGKVLKLLAEAGVAI